MHKKEAHTRFLLHSSILLFTAAFILLLAHPAYSLNMSLNDTNISENENTGLRNSSNARNLTVKIYTPLDFSDILLGFSTGGYRLISEKGTTYTIRVFVKNGMTDKSLHNLTISGNTFPFEIKKITPEQIGQLKPLEIVIFYVDLEIPENASRGIYPINFDVESYEFTQGIFFLEDELRVVERIKKEFYPVYSLIILGIIGIVVYRMLIVNKINRKYRESRRMKLKK